MSQRYIQRCRLERQQYGQGCPVELDAGALLEDTKLLRLVGQLRFKNVSRREISSVTVTVHLLDDSGAETGAVSFAYTGLSVQPGMTCADRTAIPLPLGDTRCIAVTVESVSFGSGVWKPGRVEKEVRDVPAKTPAEKRGKKWMIPVIAAAVVVAAIVIVLAIVLGGDGESGKDTFVKPEQDTGVSVKNDGQADASSEESTAGETSGDALAEEEPVREPDVFRGTAPGETGEVVTVYLTEDENGRVFVNPDVIGAYVDSTTSCFTGVPYMDDDIQRYISDSFSFAAIIRDGLSTGISGDGYSFRPDAEPESTFCAFAFDASNGGHRLVAYFVGQLTEADETTWSFDMKLCDYELAPLYEEERARFDDGRELLYSNYIAPEAVADSGAVYFLRGYNTGRSADMREDDCQMYHLFYELTSPYVERFARSMSRFDNYRIYVSENCYVCCLLLDEDYNYIGYTVLDASWNK